MTTPAIEKTLTQLRKRWDKLVTREEKTTRFSSWEEPTLIRKLGVVSKLNVMNTKTYANSSAEVVVIPWAEIEKPKKAIDAFVKKLEALTSKGLARLLKKPLPELCEAHGISLVTFVEGMFEADEATNTRRREALDWAEKRFPAAAERMKEVYGLRLPRYVATFAGFWRSLDDYEKKGLDHLGRSPGGIMVWFEDTGLTRKTRDNLDPRLECRFRKDPPELVTLMWGDSDGLHYGLWYDDPADLPTYIAHNYARDSSETWRDRAHTPLGLLLERAEERIRNADGDEAAPLSVIAVHEALKWFVQADAQALAQDSPAKRWLTATRIPSIGTFGPGLPPKSGTIKEKDTHKRLGVWRNNTKVARQWMEAAKADCAKGKPAAALTYGLDLLWVDDDKHRKEGEDLLLMAYEKLGRQALGEIAKVHFAHRDLSSVGVYLNEGEEAEAAATA